MRYDLESTLPERAFKKSLFKNAPATLEGGGKGGGGGGQTTSTSYQTNIPEYAQPYVETMLGATQKQLFNMDGSGNITGFQPYKAYGGTYDSSGNQTGYDPSKAVAGFSPLQKQAQQSAGNLQTPGQFGSGTAMTGLSGIRSMQAGQDFQNMATNPNAVSAYMNPYIQNSLAPQLEEMQRQYGITGTQQAGQATQAGAFGGGRDAIMAAENQRNKNMAMNQAIGQGYNTAFNNAQQQMNAGAQLNLQGLGQAGQAGASLANIGGQELAAQQGILNTQNQVGAQQQANQQQIINQSMQDYANAQQYPLMQLGTMSNMLRGLPMQAQTTNQYVAAPNPITQGIGLAGAGASLYNATKAEGGVVKAAKGGIMSYDVGGAVYSDLLDMEPEQLTQYIKESSSPRVKSMAEQILKDKTGKAGGGILHYKEGEETKSRPSNTDLMFQKMQAQKDSDLAPYNKMVAEENARLAARSPAPAANPELVNRAYADAAKLNAFNMPTSTPISKAKVEDIDKTNLGIKDVTPTAVKTPVKNNGWNEESGSARVIPREEVKTPIVNPVPPKPVVPTNQNPNAITAAKPVVPVATASNEKNAAEDLGKPPVLEKDTRSLADYIKEIRNETPANLGNQEARSKAMAERVNAADEAKRTANMRMAEFFAAWGSSPGNTITAGLNALKNKIPDMIGDAKEATKIRREIDKDIAAIDKIDREEELGTIKDARAAKEKVAERAETRYGHKLTAYVSLENSKRQAETSKYVADVGYKSAVDSARIRSSNSGGGGGNTYKTDNQAYNQAVRSKQNEEKLFDKSLESTPYGGYKAYLNNPENQKKDPKKWAAAENYVKQKNEERRQLLAPYDEDINYYKGRLGRDVPTQNAPQVPMYATNGKDRIVSNDGGKTWQPVGGK